MIDVMIYVYSFSLLPDPYFGFNCVYLNTFFYNNCLLTCLLHVVSSVIWKFIIRSVGVVSVWCRMSVLVLLRNARILGAY